MVPPLGSKLQAALLSDGMQLQLPGFFGINNCRLVIELWSVIWSVCTAQSQRVTANINSTYTNLIVLHTYTHTSYACYLLKRTWSVMICDPRKHPQLEVEVFSCPFGNVRFVINFACLNEAWEMERSSPHLWLSSRHESPRHPPRWASRKETEFLNSKCGSNHIIRQRDITPTTILGGSMHCIKYKDLNTIQYWY